MPAKSPEPLCLVLIPLIYLFSMWFGLISQHSAIEMTTIPSQHLGEVLRGSISKVSLSGGGGALGICLWCYNIDTTQVFEGIC